MSTSTDDYDTLEQDADFSSPLRRVAYQAGMLLGLEATRDEQSYHRQRLNRQQYWLSGSGTLLGMAITVDPAESETEDPITTRLNVSPGIGIDGLGREVLIHEAYCIDLGEWLKAQSETELRNGYDEDENALWLRVTVRYTPCEVAKQPVLATKLNLSTDAVQASRTADSVLLEIEASTPNPTPDDTSEGYQPWANHPNLADEAPTTLSDVETALLAQTDADNAEQGRQMHMQARLLHAFDGDSLDLRVGAAELEEGARLLLAQVEIRNLSDLNSILDADANDAVLNPNNVHVNNLVRPFLFTPSQLAYLQRSQI